jgi:hypothetical protein
MVEDTHRYCIVVARFRPQNKVELASGGEPIVEFENEQSCKINVSLLSRLRKGKVWWRVEILTSER